LPWEIIQRFENKRLVYVDAPYGSRVKNSRDVSIAEYGRDREDIDLGGACYSKALGDRSQFGE
jgi:hypothetical protein